MDFQFFQRVQGEAQGFQAAWKFGARFSLNVRGHVALGVLNSIGEQRHEFMSALDAFKRASGFAVHEAHLYEVRRVDSDVERNGGNFAHEVFTFRAVRL